MKSTRTYLYYVLLPDADRNRLLLTATADGWSLPGWTATGFELWQRCTHVNAAVRERWGATVTTLQCLSVAGDDGQRIAPYELENHDPAWQPAAPARWFSHEELDDISVVEEQRGWMNGWFAEAEAGFAGRQIAWAQPGWFAEVGSWLAEQLAAHKIVQTGAIEQLISWERSCILRLPTDSGDLYLKAVPPMFAHEPRLTQLMGEQLPDSFPQVVAVDKERNWLLMRDFGGTTLEKVAKPDRWHAAMQGLALVQQTASKQLAQLQAIGCPTRTAAQLAAEIEPFFASLPTYKVNEWFGLSDDEIAAIQARGPELTAAHQLAAYPLPHTLNHGDLWPGNVTVTGNDVIFFDWSDSLLTHPFFDPILLLDPENVASLIEAMFVNDPALCPRLRDDYLCRWQSYAPLANLQAAYVLAELLAPVHYALQYHLLILPRMQQRWQMGRMLTMWLRVLLR